MIAQSSRDGRTGPHLLGQEKPFGVLKEAPRVVRSWDLSRGRPEPGRAKTTKLADRAVPEVRILPGTERRAPTDRRRRPCRIQVWRPAHLVDTTRAPGGLITTTPRYRSTGSPRTATVPPERRPPSLLKPLGRSKEVRQRDSQECHGPSAALFPALGVIPSQDRADTQAPPQRQWPIQGRVTDISALCNANRFLGLVSPWRTTVWGLGTEPGITDCTPGPDQGRCART
jgi:hypothetical protein